MLHIIAQVVRSLLSLYALLLLVQFALPYVTSSQQPWMVHLARICEPGIRVGNNVAAKLFGNRPMKIDVGALTAVALCYIARMILNLFF